MYRIRLLLTTILAIGLLATACSDGGDGESAEDPAPSSEVAGELTASWTGVTADTVKLGVLAVDYEALLDFGVDLDGGPVVESWEAWAAAQNERGGIGGRQVEVIVEQFLPIGEEQATAGCVSLTEDHEVFLVSGQLLDDLPLCVTEAHETPYLGMFGLTPERAERSKAPFLAVEMAMDEQRRRSAEILVDQGILDGKRVGVHWDAADTGLAEEIVLPILEEGGVNVVETSILEDFATDTQASAEAMDINMERLRDAEVEVVVNISNVLGLMPALERNNFTPDLVFFNGQASDGGMFDDVDARFLEGATAITVDKPTVDELSTDELFVECIEEYNATDPADPLLLSEMSLTAVRQIQTTCAGFRMFVLLAEAAGTGLTPDSLLVAAEGYGEIRLPGVADGSLGPGKLSAQNSMRLYEFDPAIHEMVPTGGPISLSD